VLQTQVHARSALEPPTLILVLQCAQSATQERQSGTRRVPVGYLSGSEVDTPLHRAADGYPAGSHRVVSLCSEEKRYPSGRVVGYPVGYLAVIGYLV